MRCRCLTLAASLLVLVLTGLSHSWGSIPRCYARTQVIRLVSAARVARKTISSQRQTDRPASEGETAAEAGAELELKL